MKSVHAAFKVAFLATLCLGATGCAKKESPAPAWPEQPSPSYPAPDQSEADAPEAKTEERSEPPQQAAAPAQSSDLAKEYKDHEALETLTGDASYYADSLAGNHTANGDIYDPTAFTAAHKKLAFGTIVRVVREDTGAVTYARINDRGPFGDSKRIIDLSRAAATQLDMMKAGVVKVRVEIVELPKKK